jgi:hypothetical protein
MELEGIFRPAAFGLCNHPAPRRITRLDRERVRRWLVGYDATSDTVVTGSSDPVLPGRCSDLH